MRVVALHDTEQAVRELGTAVLAGLGVSPLAPDSVVPSACEGRQGEFSRGGVYSVTGFWQVPLPAERHRPAVRQLHDRWRAAGYRIADYRELDDGVMVVFSADDPDGGYSITLISAQPPTAVAMMIDSPCVRSPDGRYPG